MITTTLEELEGFHIVKSIVRSVVASDRVVMRDTQTYCGILLDDTNRKPICRLFFNQSQKYIGLFDTQKNCTRFPIARLDDIYSFAEHLCQTARQYDQPQSGAVGRVAGRHILLCLYPQRVSRERYESWLKKNPPPQPMSL